MLRDVIQRMVEVGNVEENLDAIARVVQANGYREAWAGRITEASPPFARECVARVIEHDRIDVHGDTAAVPIRVDARPIGALAVAGNGGFSDEAISTLETVAAVTGLAITMRRTADDGRSVLDSIPDFVARHDLEGRHIYCNTAILREFGGRSELIIGKTPRDIAQVGSATGERLLEAIGRAISERANQTLDIEAVKLDGTTGTFEVCYIPELDAHGEVTSVLGVIHETTQRRLAEAAAVERERAYRSLAENTPDLIVRWGRNHARLYVNPAFARMIGQSPTEIAGTRLGTLYEPELLPTIAPHLVRLQKLVEQVFVTGEAIDLEIPWLQHTGRRIYDLRLIPERVDEGVVASVLGIGRDITVVRESEREARTLSDSSPDLIARFDQEGCYRFVNKALLRACNATMADFIGRHVADMIGDDADCRILREHVDTACREARTIEAELTLPLGGTPHVYDVRLIPELDEIGRLASVLLVGRDVTERRVLEERLRQAQKMEAIGQLAGGIAHDFNNMLAVILMQAGLAARAPTNPRIVSDAITAITDITERAARLTQQLLMFGRRQRPRLAQVDLRDLITNITNLLRRVLGEHITIEMRMRGQLPQVSVDVVMIEQVLVNLGINARDAMANGGTLTVGLEPIEITDDQPGRKPGKYARISVIDTGTGIDPAVLPRIFEPFFTTKEVGKGSGLGLATVYSIVEQHEGWIDVVSELGRGTQFLLYFPAAVGPVEQPAAPPPAVVATGGHETILLVEDEDAVRGAIRSTLEQYGYQVIEAGTAEAALAADIDRVDLLLTDLIMPGGMSGLQLAERILSKAPRVKVIYMSGYGAELVTRLSDVHHVLPKPFAPEVLAAHVRRCLDG